jgi:hypothetical protein
MRLEHFVNYFPRVMLTNITEQIIIVHKAST